MRKKVAVSTLADFALTKRRAARRAACSVCALPEDIRTQIKGARDKKIDMPTVREWLSGIGHKIKADAYRAHGSGHHDQGDD